MKLTFMGATGTVTGSKYLVEDGGRRLLVDCGLFQGRKDLRLRNWSALPVPPASVDAVVLTHAHLDHSGYIPLLVKNGFRGPVYCSEATFDLCKILLPDSGHIQEEDAESANRHGYSRHHPALPLYTEQDALKCLSRFRPAPFGRPHALGGEMSFTLHHAGHILGASFVELRAGDGTTVLFSGDIGRMEDPIMKPPARIEEADYLVMESTYGDRLHDRSDPAEDIGKLVCKTVARGGTVLIPAFAVGRAQSILYHLYTLKKKGGIPRDLPVYLDSPMAIDASDLLIKHPNDHRLPPGICADVCGVAQYTRTTGESRSLDAHPSMPKIIVSASGMATGGRILHHLKHYMGDRRNMIVLAGHQAEGTRGHRLARGERELKFHGRMWPAEAEVAVLGNMSAHADRDEILAWLRHFRNPPRTTFITHGEPAAAESLKRHIGKELGWDVTVPRYLQEEEF